MFDDTYQNTVELGSVAAFDNVECSKAQAMKVLEEAAEVFGAWQKREKVCGVDADDLIGELCDVIQECCNMAAAVGCDDLRLALWDCEDRNRKRGRITSMVDRVNQRTREKCKRFVFVPIEVRQKLIAWIVLVGSICACLLLFVSLVSLLLRWIMSIWGLC